MTLKIPHVVSCRDPVACPVPGVRAATSSASRIGPVGTPGPGTPLGRSQAIRLNSSAGSIPAASTSRST